MAADFRELAFVVAERGLDHEHRTGSSLTRAQNAASPQVSPDSTQQPPLPWEQTE